MSFQQSEPLESVIYVRTLVRSKTKQYKVTVRLTNSHYTLSCTAEIPLFSSHRRQRQDKTVLSGLVCVGGVNKICDETKLFSLQYVEDY